MQIFDDPVRSLLVEGMLQAGVLTIRDVDGGAEPFLYSAGNYGPGYVSIKGLVGRPQLMNALTAWLAVKVAQDGQQPNFVAGNVTGGLVPGQKLRDHLSVLLAYEPAFVYVRGTRKLGGHKERVTGIEHLDEGDRGIVVEELVNFAETTCNNVLHLRGLGFEVRNAAAILTYNNPVACAQLRDNNIDLISFMTLDELLTMAQRYGTHGRSLIESYRNFLEDPLGWQSERGFVPREKGGTR
jgi:orotate phosphoribosyltransferase